MKENNFVQKYLNKTKLLVPLLIAILILMQVNSFTANSTGKIFDFAITSGQNANISGSSFKTFIVVGDAAAVMNSSNFKTETGSLAAAYYVDGESCQINVECAGGYCCSSVCQSSTCPTPSTSSETVADESPGDGSAYFAPTKNFTIGKEIIKVSVKQGATYKTQFSITNTGSQELLLEINASELKDLLLLNNTRFNLSPSKLKYIDVVISTSEDKKPDVYTGSIKIKGGDIIKLLPVVIEVQSKNALFDVIVKVLPQYKNVLMGEKVEANITLINVANLTSADVDLYYSLNNIDGKSIANGSEKLNIKKEASIIKGLEMPLSIPLGAYLFYAKLSYGKEIAAASDMFNVVKERATCSDGIKNQNEENIDCGGACSQCKGLSSFFKPTISFVFGHILIISLALIFVMSAAAILWTLNIKWENKGAELRRNLVQKKSKELAAFINRAFTKGYKLNDIRNKILSKGLPEEIVDRAVSIVEQRSKKAVDYIDKMLDLGYPTAAIRKSLLKSGWPKDEVEKFISEAVSSKLEKLAR